MLAPYARPVDRKAWFQLLTTGALFALNWSLMLLQPAREFHRAAIEGSSLYDLPGVLHWFTGNIGFDHIHHLASRIPNYRLKECSAGCPSCSASPA